MPPLRWPPTFPDLETPDFLTNVRGDFPPQRVIDAELAELRRKNPYREPDANFSYQPFRDIE